MGKKVVRSKKASPPKIVPQPIELGPQKSPDFSISEKKYLEFFGFLKEVHLSPGQESTQKDESSCSLDFISNTLMNFFNHARNYTMRQLECSTICLANLFNAINSNLGVLTFSREFVLKLRRFGSDLVESTDRPGYQQKVQALLYILVVLIYKEKGGESNQIRQLNNCLFKDKILVGSLLELSLPRQKKISKFYGIVIVYLSNRKNNNKMKKMIVKSIFRNLANIDHPTSLLNLLVYLRIEKNKVSINLQDLQEGNIVAVLAAAYPKHIHEYQSFYILDYLHHLLTLFPSLAKAVTASNFIPYLLETAGPINLHHPMHESTIITFVQSTLKYLENTSKQILIEEIAKIQPFNQYITVKLVQMLIDFEIEPSQLLVFAYKGYFDRLLEVIGREEQEGIRKRAVEQYLKVVDKLKPLNEATSSLLLFRLRNCVQKMRNAQLLGLVAGASSQQDNHWM